MTQRILQNLLLIYLTVWPSMFGVIFVCLPGIDASRFWLRYIAVALAVVILLLGALTRPRTARPPKILKRVHLFGIGCVLVAFVYSTAFTAPDPALAGVMFFLDLPVVLSGFAAFLWLRELEKAFVVRICVAIVLSMLLYIMFILLFVPDYIEAAGTSWVVGLPPFFNVRQFSNYLAPATACMLGLWLVALEARRSTALLAFACLCVLWTTLFWSGGRAPVLALGLALVTGTIWMRPGNRRHFLLGGLLSAGIGMGLAQLLPRPHHSFGFLARLFDGRKYETVASLSSNRTGPWSDSITYFIEHPIFGIGYYQFSALRKPGAPGDAHFFMLDVLRDLGLVGGLAVILLVFGSFASRARHELGVLCPHCAGPFLVLVVILSQSFLDATLYLHPTTFLASLCFGVLASCRSRQRLPEAQGGRHLSATDDPAHTDAQP